ncbi:hypothetical protein MTO96_000953 [Rhipicephalus appendiculatus]
MPVYRFQGGTFDQFFELFMQGRIDFGDYFHHVAFLYEPIRDLNVLFLTFEDLKKTTGSGVLKIAEFMGQEWKRNFQENPELLSRVLEKTSIHQIKKALNKRT